ncbi:VOC family protein [Microbacterium marinilacus]|uniref:VOC family protein n=1 Tax=Microbacterium marinilacus TaxID=415209 RepID=A0ABP7B7E1_9MICO|nr:VOC family protein [Microbacterium marinilacus]MBY0687582.1 VOC family protein [Microbacterium marinilacus]
MSVPGLLDHIVIAGPDLAGVVSWFAERTGVTAAPGGAHPTGTANALVALTVGDRRAPHYIELIGPDPDVEHESLPETFGIRDLAGPEIVTYAIHPDDIDGVVTGARERGFDPGDVWDLSRRRPDGVLLEWRLTRGGSGFAVPFLIDWGDTEQPGLSDVPTLEIVSFERVERDPGPVRRVHDALALPEGSVAEVVEGEPAGYRLTVRRPDGETVTL